MKVIVLGGVDEAGKSKTIRFSTRYFGLPRTSVIKFLNQRNPPKRHMVNDTPVYIYCASPQELSGGDVQESVQILERRISGKEANALVITPFNLERKYEDSIDACLELLQRSNLKDKTHFVFLDADVPNIQSANYQARAKIDELDSRGFNVIGRILRIPSTTEDEQGRRFSDYVRTYLT